MTENAKMLGALFTDKFRVSGCEVLGVTSTESEDAILVNIAVGADAPLDKEIIVTVQRGTSSLRSLFQESEGTAELPPMLPPDVGYTDFEEYQPPHAAQELVMSADADL